MTKKYGVIPMGTKANMKRKDEKKRKHNHFPDGKTGYIPQGVGQIDLKLLKR